MEDWQMKERFGGEIGNLAKQADASEVLPELRLNDVLEVAENLADVGSVAFGIRAGDRMWLDPKERVTIW
jgi:predicted metalloendopeptidase